MRTCIGCRNTASKDSLYRFRKESSGNVSFDPRGNAPGRGAYVCSADCLETALATGRLSGALRTRIDKNCASGLKDVFAVATECDKRS